MTKISKIFSAIALMAAMSFTPGCDPGVSGNTGITCACDCAGGALEEAQACGNTPADVQPACTAACEARGNELNESCGFNNFGSSFGGPCKL